MAERKLNYTLLQHKIDRGLIVKAPSLQRLFIDAALCVTDSRLSLDLVQETHKHQLNKKADNFEKLMVAWLDGILDLFTEKNFLCKRIVFDFFNGKEIKATLHGEDYVPTRHGYVIPLKATRKNTLQIQEESSTDSLFSLKIFFEG
jgi:SHS2 domain-containing protein